jgi:1-deoxy-D-xylulose-5-phosphate reductoisomerase
LGPPDWIRRSRLPVREKKLLLANKEALVMTGELLLTAARESGATLLPVDSEHNAIFSVPPHCFGGYQR